MEGLFCASATYIFVIKNVTLYGGQRALPGLFEGNPYDNAANGSLWTLNFEFTCYLVVCLLGLLGLLRVRYVVALLLFALVTQPWVASVAGRWPGYFLSLFGYFAAGMLLYLLWDRLPRNDKLALFALVAITCSMFLGGFRVVFALCGSYILIYMAFDNRFRLYGFARWGDFSYGLYIYAFPIQQAAVQVSGGQMSWWENLMVAFPLTPLLAMLSWHAIEKRALALKQR